MTNPRSPETFHKTARIFLVSLALGVALHVVAQILGGLMWRIVTIPPLWRIAHHITQFLSLAGTLSLIVASIFSFVTPVVGVMRWKSLSIGGRRIVFAAVAFALLTIAVLAFFALLVFGGWNTMAH